MVIARIMIVEQEHAVARDLQACLESSGHEVVGIADGVDAAKELADSARPDLALLDIRFEQQPDGVDLAHELRKRNVGFLYLASRADEGTLARAEVSEPLGYVLRPFGVRELGPVLRTAMYRHAAEVRLRGMERWLSTALRSIGDGVLVTDRAGRVTYMNPVAEELTGRRMRDVSGVELVEVLPVVAGPDLAPVACVAKRAIRAEATVYVDPDAELVRADGTRLPIEDCAAPIRDADGTINGAVIVVRDATERRRLEQERRETERRLQDAERLESLAVFTSGIAHDLDNTLTAILGNVEQCRGGPAAVSAGPLQAIEAHARAAVDLCRRMLAGAQAGSVEPKATDVAAVVHDCIANERLLASAMIEFAQESERPGLQVLADPVQLRQVVSNLLRNAAEAIGSRRGNIVVRIGEIRLPSELLAERSVARHLPMGGYVWFEVGDDGPGMAEDVRLRAFEPFFTTRTNARGLGLSSVQGIVGRHRGGVEIESERGLGSVVRVFWPIAAADSAAAAPASPGNAAGTCVLVVDDDTAVRQVTCRLLRQRGFVCHEAASGDEAIELLREGLEIEAVVLDVVMPGTSGLDVLSHVRQERPELPVLLVSGCFEEMPVPDVHVHVLPKPFLIDELVAHLRRCLQQAG